MSFDIILKSKYKRRIFGVAVVAILLALIAVRFFVIPGYLNPTPKAWDLVAQILDSLIVTTLVTVSVATFLFWITPPNVRNANAEILEPRALPELFASAFPTSLIWYYKGGSGRYFRTVTLPKMAESARIQSLTRHMYAVIIDPRDSLVCEDYCRYRNGTDSAKLEGKWDSKRVQRELCATILTIFYIQLTENLTRIEVALVKSFSGFRIDISTEFTLLTREDRLAPAIKYEKDTYFYRSYQDEVILCMRPNLIVPRCEAIFELKSLTHQMAAKLLSDAGITIPEFMESDYEEIVKLCANPVDPYGKKNG